MSAAKFTRIEICIYRNKSLSNTAQIYDVTYMARQAVGSVGKSSTHAGGEGGALSNEDTAPPPPATRRRLTPSDGTVFRDGVDFIIAR
jgi:hypothetical protein